MFNRGIANVSKKRSLTRKAWRKIEWGWVVTFKKTMALELIGTDIKGGTFLERGSGFSGKVIINSKYKFYFTTLI